MACLCQGLRTTMIVTDDERVVRRCDTCLKRLRDNDIQRRTVLFILLHRRLRLCRDVTRLIVARVPLSFVTHDGIYGRAALVTVDAKLFEDGKSWILYHLLKSKSGRERHLDIDHVGVKLSGPLTLQTLKGFGMWKSLRIECTQLDVSKVDMSRHMGGFGAPKLVIISLTGQRCQFMSFFWRRRKRCLVVRKE